MTKWEIGQDLIAINDFIAEKAVDIADSDPMLAMKLQKIRAEVGELFNENNDHTFGIFDRYSYDKLCLKEPKP